MHVLLDVSRPGDFVFPQFDSKVPWLLQGSSKAIQASSATCLPLFFTLYFPLSHFRELCRIPEEKLIRQPDHQSKHHLLRHGVLGVSAAENHHFLFSRHSTTHQKHVCRLQETRTEDLLGHRQHGLAKLGPGLMPVHRVGHVLLLHLEGDQVDRKG